MNPEITLLHVHAKSMGYGRYGVYLADRLAARDVNVFDHFAGPDGEPCPPGYRSAIKPTNVVCWVAVPGHGTGWWKGQHTVISTMWEAMQLPEAFRNTISEFDTVIVPSLHNQELFGTYHDNVHYVPLGIDPNIWHPTPKPPPSPFFNFLVAGSGNRKGTDLAVRAFKRLWGTFNGDGPVPRLLMKNPRNENYFGDRIEVLAGKMSAEEEVALYASAHCYLGPSRGEGFGLQPLQAMAQGTPTILTNAHGHAAYAHLGVGLDWKPVESGYFMHGYAGDWWEPDFDQLCELMLDVYDNYTVYRLDAQRSAEVIAREWTWDQTAEKFQAVLGDQLTVPYSGPMEWHIPKGRFFLAITTQRFICEIAGTKYCFEPGKEYYVPADVKRVLYEARKLDLRCLSQYLQGDGAGVVDMGLTEEEVEQYRADREWCPTCNQRVNSGVNRADEIFAELEAAAS